MINCGRSTRVPDGNVLDRCSDVNYNEMSDFAIPLVLAKKE